jgi:hypothetical protein
MGSRPGRNRCGSDGESVKEQPSQIGLRAESKFSCAFKLIWAVQTWLQKDFASRLRQISSLIRTVLSHRGACARHERGAGCGGRGSVRRCQGMAGRVDKARELTNGTQTNDAFRGRQSRVVLAPVAGVKFAEARRPDRACTNL